MMKKTLTLTIALLLCGLAVAQHKEHRHARISDEKISPQDSLAKNQYDGAHIAFTLTKHDFGVVKRKGGDLHVHFDYVNDGTEPLVITRIATSCTCIRVDFRRRPLDPGENATIELTYEPHKMEPGMFHKVVQVYSNSVEGMRLLTISGNSVEK